MRSSRAFRIDHDGNGHRASIETLTTPDPQSGEVIVQVSHSSVNYKDALAGTGRGKILSRFPLTGGIDASGQVLESAHPDFQPGDSVLTTGQGLSHDRDGGYADLLLIPGDWLLHRPDGLEESECMILGTAGLTAALAVHQMLLNGQHPGMGPILVTGASGGVGSLAIGLLARLGFEVAALSRKPDLHDWLTSLGAARMIDPKDLPATNRPLEKARWGGAIDNLGGDILSQLTRTLVPNGCIASIGLAAGNTLNTTVMPFILRGIKLLGCNSVDVPMSLRRELWQRLATDWRPPLEAIHTRTIGLYELPPTFDHMLSGKTHGRILVDLARQESSDHGNNQPTR